MILLFILGMGIDGLTTCMQQSKELTGMLSSLPRSVKIDGGLSTCVLAWDISGSLYPPLRKDGADDYWSLPPRPVTAVTTYLDRIVNIFLESNIELIAVLMGATTHTNWKQKFAALNSQKQKKL